MIAGLEKIDEGEIFINDQKINELHPSKRQTAMVFQSYALYPHMNVYENMSFGLKIEKRPKEEINTKVMQAAKILKIAIFRIFAACITFVLISSFGLFSIFNPKDIFS